MGGRGGTSDVEHHQHLGEILQDRMRCHQLYLIDELGVGGGKEGGEEEKAALSLYAVGQGGGVLGVPEVHINKG